MLSRAWERCPRIASEPNFGLVQQLRTALADVVKATARFHRQEQAEFRRQLATMRRWIKPAGMVLMMASTRNGSPHKVVEQAKQLFPVVKASTAHDSPIPATFTAGHEHSGSRQSFGRKRSNR